MSRFAQLLLDTAYAVDGALSLIRQADAVSEPVARVQARYE
ncbi:MAG: hypothetical protein ACYC1E_05970 [Propionibacteriaceae bacterium]